MRPRRHHFGFWTLLLAGAILIAAGTTAPFLAAPVLADDRHENTRCDPVGWGCPDCSDTSIPYKCDYPSSPFEESGSCETGQGNCYSYCKNCGDAYDCFDWPFDTPCGNITFCYDGS